MSKKSAAIEALEAVYNERKRAKYPSMPDYAVPWTKFTVKDANSLTRAIVAHINLMPQAFAFRVNVTGIWDQKLGAFRKSNAKKGASDVIAVIKGKPYFIEVKWSNDRLSEKQKDFAKDAIEAGGVYMVAKKFEAFVEDLKQELAEAGRQIDLF